MNLSERIAALEPRERRLLGTLGAVLVVLLIASVPFVTEALLNSKMARNESLRQALADVEAEAPAVLKRRAERDALLVRYETPPPALAGFLARAATETGFEIPELKDGSPVARGKKYEERSTSISIRKVGLRELVLFMEKVSGGVQPISVSKLNVRRHSAPPDVYDVQMTVSAYHRLATKAAEPEAP
jgi:type II secretory pathway component PulM